MKKSKFTEAQIAFVLKQADEGTAVAEVCRKAGISDATFYNWRKRYGGMMPSEVRKLRQIEEENAKLKRLVADLSLDKAMLQDVLAKNVWSAPSVQDFSRSFGRKCDDGLVRMHSALKTIKPVAQPIPGSIQMAKA